MGWFSEQIEQRKKQDNEVFEDAFIRLAGSVLGEEEAARLSGRNPNIRDAVKGILRYYGIKEHDIPSNITDFSEKLEYVFRPKGIMYRSVTLEKGWYKEAYGPMLAWHEDTGEPVALLPKGNIYYFYDDAVGKSVKVTSKTEEYISEQAILFYEPFPLKKLNVAELLKYMVSRLNLHDVVALAAASAVVILIGMLTPVFNKTLFSTVVLSGSDTVLAAIAVFMISAVISKHLFEIVKEILTEAVGTKTSLSAEAAAMMRVLSLPPDFFKDYSAGELANRIGYIQSFCQLMVSSVFSTGLTSILSLVYIGEIFIYAPELVSAAITIIAVTVALSVISTLWQSKISYRRMQYAAKENGIGFSFISGIQKIRLAGAEKRAFAKWAEVYAEEASLTYDPPLFLKLNTAINTAVSLVGLMVIYYLAVSADIGVADFYAFNTSYGMVQGAFMALANTALIIADAKPILDMCKPILEAEPEVSEGKQIVTRINGGIEMSNVSFAYKSDMPKVIDKLNLRIRPGQYVAIVGETGCGKSTLMRLLLGFEKPQRGAVYYDGIDIQRMDLRSLRRKIGVVMQDGKLFQGDIFSNIAISAPDITLKEAWDAAETAGIADDIRQMPMGMNTLISEGSGGISGGQRQRLMIARAIASKPKILMFDEATSALDNITQKKVSEALDKLKCTRIIIAHRLSTIMQCDRIIVLKNGQIAEDGTYSQLTESDGLFAELVRRQRLDK
ncbi:MAG: NHLP bacteriocin export ABC transporter permease/ATPase subunit [Firmicutes bacterium]|nr:NHLP bacteriocin export ABC transporter permease/ATPase subunit [Bacillota bacterium]